MTQYIYGKIQNGQFYPAPYGTIEWLEANGYSAFDIELHARMNTNPQQVIVKDGTLYDRTNDSDYKEEVVDSQLEILTGQYTNDKCERMVSWVATFINGISTATSLDDIKSKANAFKTKLATLQSDYTTKCAEVENV